MYQYSLWSIFVVTTLAAALLGLSWIFPVGAWAGVVLAAYPWIRAMRYVRRFDGNRPGDWFIKAILGAAIGGAWSVMVFLGFGLFAASGEFQERQLLALAQCFGIIFAASLVAAIICGACAILPAMAIREFYRSFHEPLGQFESAFVAALGVGIPPVLFILNIASSLHGGGPSKSDGILFFLAVVFLPAIIVGSVCGLIVGASPKETPPQSTP